MTDTAAAPPATPTWREALFNRRMLICVFTGFSSGLPLYLLINLLPAWLRSEHVDLKSIGLFALIQLPYTWKFLWSPLLDRYAFPAAGPPPRLDARHAAAAARVDSALRPAPPARRTSGRSRTSPPAVAFFSASQDIVLDAYRREILPDVELGLGNAIHVNAYRISSLVPGALALILADHLPWSSVYWVTARSCSRASR